MLSVLADKLPAQFMPGKYLANPRPLRYADGTVTGMANFTQLPGIPVNHMNRLKDAYKRGGLTELQKYIDKQVAEEMALRAKRIQWYDALTYDQRLNVIKDVEKVIPHQQMSEETFYFVLARLTEAQMKEYQEFVPPPGTEAVPVEFGGNIEAKPKRKSKPKKAKNEQPPVE